MVAVTSQIIEFIRSIGIRVDFGEIAPEKQFLPGMCIENSGLMIDLNTLKYPGDLLHEAGHIAVTAPEKRALIDGVAGGDSDQDQGEAMMAIAWSYAAAKYLDIDPHIVFHKDGYKGGGISIVQNFSQGNFFGVPLLQWIGLTYEPKIALEKNTDPYPKMIKWVRE